MTISTTVKAALVGLASIGFVGAVFVSEVFSARQKPLLDDALVPAEAWVPLTITFDRLEHDAVIAAYTEYRFSDGSTRLDRQDGHEAEITNHAAKKYFRLHHGDWQQHPMRPQPNEGKPYRRLARAAVHEIDRFDPRVRAFAEVGVPLTFFEHKAHPDDVSVFCPELNMMEVWNRHSSGGRVFERRVTGVVLGEPQVALSPPSGAKVIERHDPAGPGLVRRPHTPGSPRKK
jgi:hypothetical protein